MAINAIWQFLRYSFLIAGIIYGASKLKTLQIIEEGKKEERERRKREREARIVEERRAASERDIAEIVAIFKGKPEIDSEVSQSYLPENSKLETEEIKHKVGEENNISNNLSTCTVEVVKQMVQDDKTAPNPTVNTEFGSDQDGTNVLVADRGSVDVSDSDNGDIYSGVFNLTTTKDKKCSRSENLHKPNEENGYYVETFADRIPYAEQEACKEDFFNKDDKWWSIGSSVCQQVHIIALFKKK